MEQYRIQKGCLAMFLNVDRIYVRNTTICMGSLLLFAIAAIAQTGRVYAGATPISGANVQLMTAGSNGYGSDGTNLLGSAIVTTASNGSFSITGDYTCPTSSTLVSLTASGGKASGGSNNSAIVLVTPLGVCGNLSSSSSFVLNEVTTAAAAFALGQYFTTSYGSSSIDSFGAPNGIQSHNGLVNAFALVNNLVNVATGSVQTSVTLTGSGSLGSITATPEFAKLSTIANILDACAASSGSGSTPCVTLMPDVATTSGTLPSDVLQAAVYMSLNPTSNNSNGSAANLSALYALQTSSSPFAGLTVKPADWTLGIQYVGSPTTNLVEPIKLAIDSAGNLWVAGNASSGTYTGALSEISPTGTPMVFLTAFGSQSLSQNIKDIAVDLSGNVWFSAVTGPGGGYYQYNPSTSTGGYYLNSRTPYGIAVDASNNVYFSQESTSAAFTLLGFPNGTTLSSSGSTTGVPAYEFPIAGSTPGTAGTSNTFVNPEALAFDINGNLWMSSSSGQPTSTQIVELSNLNTTACVGAASYPCSLATSAILNTYTGTSSGIGSMSEPWGLTTGAAGSVWTVNAASGANSISNVTSPTAGTNYTVGLNGPRFIALDGAANVWVSNNSTSSVSEFSSNGILLSPGSPAGFVHSGIDHGYGIAIDPSGNVWVASQGSATTPSLEEIVGAAAPAITPIAMGLSEYTNAEISSYPSTPQAPTTAQINSNPQPALAPGSSPLSLGINVVNSPLYTAVTQVSSSSGTTYSYSTAATPYTHTYTTSGGVTTSVIPTYPWVFNNSAFSSLSFEKSQLSGRLLATTDTAMINFFNLLYPPHTGGIVRIGGDSANEYTWTPDGAGQTAGQIAPADVDALAAFLSVTGWKAIYAINEVGGNGSTASPTLAGEEAAYVTNALGSSLYGFEIGNEPDGYVVNGYEPTGWGESDCIALFESFASGIHSSSYVPAAPLVGPATTTVNGIAWFGGLAAAAHSGEISDLTTLTQHYYLGPPSDPTPTVADLITYPDTNLISEIEQLEYYGYTNDIHWRLDEANSYYAGGTSGVSDAYVTSLWSIDELFTLAQFGGEGANFHTGNSGYYSEITASGNTVTGVRPLFLGMYLSAQTGTGYLQRLNITGNSSNQNITAYAVQPYNAAGTLNVVVNNKSGYALNITLTPGMSIGSGSLQILTDSLISSYTPPLTTAEIDTVLGDATTSDVTIQGATINSNGTYTANSPYTLPVAGNATTFTVPPLSVALVRLQ